MTQVASATWPGKKQQTNVRAAATPRSAQRMHGHRIAQSIDCALRPPHTPSHTLTHPPSLYTPMHTLLTPSTHPARTRHAPSTHPPHTLTPPSTQVRVITQNIDGLHGRAGLPEEWAVEVHGRADLFKCACYPPATLGAGGCNPR